MIFRKIFLNRVRDKLCSKNYNRIWLQINLLVGWQKTTKHTCHHIQGDTYVSHDDIRLRLRYMLHISCISSNILTLSLSHIHSESQINHSQNLPISFLNDMKQWNDSIWLHDCNNTTFTLLSSVTHKLKDPIIVTFGFTTGQAYFPILGFG